MSKKYEGFIAAYEDFSWRGDSLDEYHPLYVDNESFDTGKEIINNNNMTRAGRSSNIDSQVSGAVKPSAQFTYQPRNKDILGVLYSHFQMGTQYGTDKSPGTYVLVPSRTPPTYSVAGNHVEGDYDTVAGDVYSMSFIKKYFDTTENGGTNAMFFKHGICDKLTVNMAKSEDITFDCSYKFSELIEGSAVSDNPPGTAVGTYDNAPPLEWFHGTVFIDGVELELDSLSFTGNNNILEKITVSGRDPDSFPFRGYDLNGEFTYDFPKDGMLQIGSMFDIKPFAIVGTILQGTVAMMFSMPKCVRQPFNVDMNNINVDATIPFKAFEDSGTPPISVKLIADGTSIVFDDFIWDAWNGVRTFGDFAIKDAGNGARTLSEYTFYDRNL
jgi:hypothetical protein